MFCQKQTIQNLFTQQLHPIQQSQLIRNISQQQLQLTDQIFEIYSYPDHFKIGQVQEINLFYKKYNIPHIIQLFHSLAHIEYNAMLSYSDTIFRFQNKIYDDYGIQKHKDFVRDFLSIAQEEAQHFQLIHEYLSNSNISYGSIPVISNLKENAQNTQNSLTERLAVISIAQESKALDQGPRLLSKTSNMDKNAQQILQKIINDEVKHVFTGLKWFKFLLSDNYNDQQMLDIYLKILKKNKIQTFPPINHQLREQAGFTELWIKNIV